MAIQLRKENLDLHKGGEDLTLLHISDIHVWYSKRILEKLKAIIYQQDPELLLLTGDYFDTKKGAHLFREFLVEVSHNYKIFFIRGNHDFAYGLGVADLLLGIPNCYCLESSVYSFTSRQGYSYHITSWDQRQQLKKQMGERNIVLIHNPEKLKEKEMDGIDLILAGHLHGGQFILFKSPDKSHFPGNLLYRYCTDKKQVKGTTIIISRGVGDTFPFRINCPKEVIKIRVT